MADRITMKEMRSRLEHALLQLWSAQWSEQHGGRPSLRVMRVLRRALRATPRNTGSLKFADSTGDAALLQPVFPQGLPELGSLNELAEPVAAEIERVRRRLDIVGDSAELMSSLYTAACFAQTKAPALIQGETGTGKELVARFVHEMSPRSKQPFVALNCAAIQETLFLSELFGYEAGSFTGAGPRGKMGKAETAHRGSLFIDEIAELSLPLQAALLRFVDTGEIHRIGLAVPRQVDVRVIAATHRDLADLVRRGLFRADLYYRIALLPVTLLPLRSRHRDIPQLVNHFLRQLDREHRRRSVTEITTAALRALTGGAWSGNVRELKFAITRAYLMALNHRIDKSDLQLGQSGLTSCAALDDPQNVLASRLRSVRAPLRGEFARWYQFLISRDAQGFQNRDVCVYFECSDSAARIKLSALVAHGVLVAEGSNKGRRYFVEPGLL